MKGSVLREKPLLVFLFSVTLYLLIAPGHIAHLDGEILYLLTEAVAERGRVDIQPGLMEDLLTTRQVDGKVYVYWELGQPLLAVPFYLLGKLFLWFMPGLPGDFVLRFFVSFFNPLVTALIPVYLYRSAMVLGLSKRASLLGAICASSFTMLPFYSKTFFREPLTALLLLMALFYLFVHAERGGRMELLASGCCFGYLLFTRFPMVMVVPFCALYLLVICRGRSRLWVNFALLLTPVLLFFTLSLLYNYARYGSLFDFGQVPSEVMGRPIMQGLKGELFSSSKGIFFYNPVLVLALPGAFCFLKRKPCEGMLILAICAAVTLFFSRSTAWGSTWGPRFLLPVLPMALLFIAELTDRVVVKRIVWRGLLGVSLVVQTLSVIPAQDLHFARIGLFREGGLPLSEFAWNFRYNPIWGQLQSLKELSLSPLPSGNLKDSASRKELFRTPNFWWCYLYRLSFLPLPFLLLLLVFLGGAASWSGLRLYRALIQGKQVG